MTPLKGWLTLGVAAAVIAATVHTAPLGLGKQAAQNTPAEIHLFFSPDAPPSQRIITQFRKHLSGRRDLRLRLTLLVRDFRLLEVEPSTDFQAAVKALRDLVGPEFGLLLYDEEGLELARKLGLARLPAVVVNRGRRYHVAYGSDPDLEALLRCQR